MFARVCRREMIATIRRMSTSATSRCHSFLSFIASEWREPRSSALFRLHCGVLLAVAARPPMSSAELVHLVAGRLCL